MDFLLFVLLALGIGGGAGVLYERRKWRKATGFHRAEQFDREKPPQGGGPFHDAPKTY